MSDSVVKTIKSDFVSTGDYTISNVTDGLQLEFFDSHISGDFLFAGSTMRPISLGYFHAFRLRVGMWTMNNVVFSDHTVINDVTTEHAYWGDNPVAMARSISDHNHPKLALSPLYDSLQRTYASLGLDDLASAIAIEGREDQYRHTRVSFEKVWLFLEWIFAGYGYRPYWGFFWILGFVVAGTLVFWTGQSAISERRPRSWFIFALDAVIPWLALDKSMGSISFCGWRQWFLYFLRFLGAVVVVLILAWIKQSFRL